MADFATTRLVPGDAVGILGGGQLGRMLALAAAQLGLRAHVFCPDKRCPAFQVADHVTCADYRDEAALARFAGEVSVVTYEFENIPAEAVAYLTARAAIRPHEKALALLQDRLTEKQFLEQQGVETAPYRAVSSRSDLSDALAEIGAPAIAKTRFFGYDGKGQTKLESVQDVDQAWADLGTARSILEGFVPFDCEASVIAARGLGGQIVTWPLTENTHRNHVLHTSTVPANVSPIAASKARDAAHRIIAALDYVGVMSVEFFILGDRVIANEIAPRVHNSGHWTSEGAVTSQFENHIRAIAGWPLGATDLIAPSRMVNLLGEDIDRWADLLADPRAHVHLYGKRDARPGRKMGHATWVGDAE